MAPIVIKCFAGWMPDDESTYNLVLRMYNWASDENYGTKYQFTYGEDFTHAILFNLARPALTIPKDNVIGLAQEPIEFLRVTDSHIAYCDRHIKKYFIGNISVNSGDVLRPPYIEGMSYIFPSISWSKGRVAGEMANTKTKIMNYVYSCKTSDRYPHLLYDYRHLLGNALMTNKIDVDIYGSGARSIKRRYPGNPNVKDMFKWADIESVYVDYKFSIVIENSRHPEYFTEKITNALLCGCVPIYLGCTNIDNYFKDYVVHLTGDVVKDIRIIGDILADPDKYYRPIDVTRVQEIIHLKHLIAQEFM